MRVLLSAFACDPHMGSEEGVGWNWALETARLGHEVTVLTETTHRAAIEAGLALGEVPRTLRFEFFMPGWLDRLRERGRKLGLEGINDHLTHLVWQYLAYRHLRRRFMGMPFDLVHHVTYAGIRHPTFLGRLPCPLVLGPLGGGERAPMALRRELSWRGWLKELVRDLHTSLVRIDPITRRACADALLIYVRSEQSRRALPRRCHHKALVHLGIGIRREEMRPRAERVPGPIRLIFAGRFIDWKGMHLGLKAVAAFHDRGGEARLTMLGKGPEEARWQQLARDLRIEHALDWIAWVEHDKVGELFQAHDALLFPSLHDSAGLTVLEALALGLPVICLDLGGPAEIVTPSCGRIVATTGRSEAEVVQGLADAIAALAGSPASLRQLSEGAHARAGQLSWSNQVRRVYDDVVARLPQPVDEAAATADRAEWHRL